MIESIFDEEYMMRTIFLVGFMCLAAAISPAHAGEQLTTSEKILLQATMQRSIASHLVDGEYFYFDTAAAKVRVLYPAKTHPMILRMGQHFILCTNFRKSDGTPVNVDFYITRQDDNFVVFDTVVANRAPIKKLMQDGLAHVVK